MAGQCNEGCFCPKGTFLQDGKCVGEDECQCMFNGEKKEASETNDDCLIWLHELPCNWNSYDVTNFVAHCRGIRCMICKSIVLWSSTRNFLFRLEILGRTKTHARTVSVKGKEKLSVCQFFVPSARKRFVITTDFLVIKSCLTDKSRFNMSVWQLMSKCHTCFWNFNLQLWQLRILVYNLRQLRISIYNL